MITTRFPGEAVAAPHGHKIFRYQAPEEPGLDCTPGGVIIASLGTAGDEPECELNEVLHNISISLDKMSTHTRLVQARERIHISDLCAPAQPKTMSLQSPVQWVFHRGIADTLAANPGQLQVLLRHIYKIGTKRKLPIQQTAFLAEGQLPVVSRLAELLGILGVEVRWPEDERNTCLMEIHRPEGYVLSAIQGILHSHMTTTVEKHLARFNQQKDRAENEGDEGALQHIEKEERDYLEQFFAEVCTPGSASPLYRSPRLCRMLLEVAPPETAEGQKPLRQHRSSEESLQSLNQELLEREAPFFFMKDPHGNRMDLRSFGDHSNVFVVYSDLRCLRWAAEDMGIPPSRFVIKWFRPREIFRMAAERSLGLAIFAYDVPAPTRYIVLPPSALTSLLLAANLTRRPGSPEITKPPSELTSRLLGTISGQNEVRARDHIHIEPVGRRIEVTLGGKTIVNSNRALVLHEKGLSPRYYIPRDDVRAELQVSDKSGNCAWKGRWHCFHVKAGGKTVENGAWRYFDPTEVCEDLRDYVGFFIEMMDGFVELPASDPARQPQACPCGSGLEFSRCHGVDDASEEGDSEAVTAIPNDGAAEVNQHIEEAVRLYENGKLDAAIPIAERALALAERVHGAEHPKVANLLGKLAIMYSERKEHDDAKSFCQRALMITEKAFGAESPDVAISLKVLAQVVANAGDLDQAQMLLERGLAMQERSLGPEHAEVGTFLRSLARLHIAQGNVEQADRFFQRAADVWERSLGPEHPAVINTLEELANLVHVNIGDYPRATALLKRVSSLWEKASGRYHPKAVAARSKLAVAYAAQGEYAKAEPLLQQALAMLEQEHGAHHPDVGRALLNLGQLYGKMGDYSRAMPLSQRAVALFEQKLGLRDPLTAEALNGLGWLYWAQQDNVRARDLFERALKIEMKIYGPEHPDVARSFNNLGETYSRLGDFYRAERCYQRALGITEQTLGVEHPALAWPLGNLAFLYGRRAEISATQPATNHDVANQDDNGDFARALACYLRALTIREKALGPKHPDLAHTLNGMAWLYAHSGDVPAAIRAKERALAIEDHHANLILTTGSDEQKRAFMATLATTTHGAISLHLDVAPTAEGTPALALTTILRRKGRVLDAMAGSIAALRSRMTAEQRGLFEELRSITAKFSAHMLRGQRGANTEWYGRELARLDRTRQHLEAELSLRSAKVRSELESVTLEQICSVLPEGTALVELFLWYPLAGRRREQREPRYVAYVLHRNGDIGWADLGDAVVINAAAGRFVQSLARPSSLSDRAVREFGDVADSNTDFRPAARKLHDLVMRPIWSLLGTTRGIFMSPDGLLNCVPFNALIDEEGRYLLERCSITYLASGRDLMRLSTSTPSRQKPVVIAAPNYGAETSALATNDDHRVQRSADMRDMHFNPLQFAAHEGRAVAGKLQDAVLLMGNAATEDAVKALGGPLLLHIATHGFFLPDLLGSRAVEPDTRQQDFGGWVDPPQHIENPLIRAGIALAGANNHQEHREDGILTALEFAQIDLMGTKLVVLSACQTGVGESRSGDGVYGLRRAVAMAGAETQVMSLWNVDDAATSELMQSYYDHLLADGGRTESLRHAQLAMLKRPDRAHPFYWASFIVAGNPATLDGRHVVPIFADNEFRHP